MEFIILEALKKLGPVDRHLKLSKKDREVVFEVLSNYLHDKSRTIRMFSMQALTELAIDEAKLRPRVIALLENLTQAGSPIIQNHGRKLLSSLKQLKKR
jgi:hypothetical protein